MNVLPYEVKRAHWRGTWEAINEFRACAVEAEDPDFWNMTPARFDILYVAWRADWLLHERRAEAGLPRIERCINMSELRDILGLSGATISRTARRLDDLGWVCLVPHERDRRAVVVVLTELGERMLRRAVECIRQNEVGMSDRIARYVQERAFDGLSRNEPGLRKRTLARLGALADRWRGYARFFGSTALPIYDTRHVTHLRPHAMSLRHYTPNDPHA